MRRSSILLLLLLTTILSFGQAKYVFYFIGDGMGPNVVLLTEMYLAQRNGEIGVKPLCMTQFPHYGTATTFSTSNSITDSSAAGTCLASGEKTKNNVLGLNANGEHVPTIAEILQERGYKVGLMTSVSIDHATPGAFYGQSANRNSYYTIGKQLADSRFNFFGGASFYQPVDPNNPSSTNLYDYAEQAGYVFAHGIEEAQSFIAGGKEQVILIQKNEGQDRTKPGEGHIPYAIDRVPNALTLPQITKCAMEMLTASGDPFFMMVEGGQIDWANHANDAASAIQEVIEFDASIQLAYEFYLSHPDETLIIVTADHETGGLALGNDKYVLHLDLLDNQKGSISSINSRFEELYKQYGKKLTFDQVKAFFNQELGLYGNVNLTEEENAQLLKTFKEMKKNAQTTSSMYNDNIYPICKEAMGLLNKHAKVGWTTHSHSAAAVPVFAIGVGAERFSGYMDNSQIAPLIIEICQ